MTPATKTTENTLLSCAYTMNALDWDVVKRAHGSEDQIIADIEDRLRKELGVKLSALLWDGKPRYIQFSSKKGSEFSGRSYRIEVQAIAAFTNAEDCPVGELYYSPIQVPERTLRIRTIEGPDLNFQQVSPALWRRI